ncbi:uncharacterized protein LOC121856600 [Homarus americanus]|uniref:uncharacterized protein LOC121856600 n=1 Tax=Homarus americanus TaxID=6706 RepID=UPI001C44A352|nr:uncharacterized protein LOC121856600 [Homarus americanus]
MWRKMKPSCTMMVLLQVWMSVCLCKHTEDQTPVYQSHTTLYYRILLGQHFTVSGDPSATYYNIKWFRCAVICNFNQCHAWALDTAQDICHVYQNIDPQDTLSPAPASVQTFCSLPEHECFPLGNSSSSVGNSSSSSGSSSSSSGSSSSLIREHDEPIPLIE